MSLSKASTRLGLFTLLLSVIVLSLFGSLLAADRAMRKADQDALVLDAHGAALIAERELRLDAEALTHALAGQALRRTMGTSGPDATTLPPAFDGGWVLDSTGGVVWSLMTSRMPVDSAALTVIVREMAAPPQLRIRALARARDSTTGGLLLAVPLMDRGRRVATALGFVDGRKILATLEDSVVKRPRLALLVAGRTIATLGMLTSGTQIRASSPVLLAGSQLEIEVTHSQIGRTLRTALWMLGVIALAALLAGLARERRQAVHLAERTTELERLYQEVARSNRMKSEFLANVSHELRTPLNAIVGFVEMLREGVYGELTPRQALPVDRIAASATHLRHLVDRLLDIAKIAAGRLEVHVEPMVLRPFVLNVASEMESLVSERGLALSIAVGPALPRIRTDQTHLRQILINLIGNAVKYTPSGGINVRARILGNGSPVAPAEDTEIHPGAPPDPTTLWVALQVSDSGVGIAPADQERIFDEFEQVNAGARTDSARRGTGLGLAISRRLARLIGGDLTVVSEPGRGSVFTVWLPLESSEKRAD